MKKGTPLEFGRPLTVSIMVKDSNDGYEFNHIKFILREEDNTMILTREDGSQVIIPGSQYLFMEIKEGTDE